MNRLPIKDLTEIIGIGLLRYYQCYTDTPQDTQHDMFIIQQFSNALQDELNHICHHTCDHIDSISLFDGMVEAHIDIDDKESIQFGTELIELLINSAIYNKRQSKYTHAQYIILSIDVTPLDGFDVTHEMIMWYFKSFYK